MVSKIYISIPQPCHENWQQMTPVEKGRFCGSCQKNVIDFTNASDSEIIKALKLDSHLCGRFTSTQLERNLMVRKEKSSIWLATTSAVLSFLSIGNSDVFSQEIVKTEQTDKKLIIENNTSPDSSNPQRTITGTVSEGGLPLPEVTVVVKGTTRGVYTDMDGNFSIIASQGEILVFNFIGLNEEFILIDDKVHYTIKMIPGNQVEEYVLMGAISPRKRTFIGRTFRKIGNWFR